MTSASRDLQCGQSWSARGCPSSPPRGEGAPARLAGRGGWGRGRRRVLLLLEATQHGECVLVDRPLRGPAAERVPQVPVDRHLGCFHLELLFEARAKLCRPHAQLAALLQLLGLAVRRTAELQRL